MGLFSTVVHLRRTNRHAAIAAMDTLLQGAGFRRRAMVPIPPDGPAKLLETERAIGGRPFYLLSQPVGDWLTLIEAYYVDAAPAPAELAQQLSEALKTYALSLLVHDDDLMFYNLFSSGRELDGYNSCPQYFEQEKLAEGHIESQRHSPEELAPIFPAGVSITQLSALLNRGWWNAHDTGTLDNDGVEPESADGFVFEGERMTAFGTMLELHGSNGEYPYAAWLEDPNIRWSEFEGVSYGGAS